MSLQSSNEKADLSWRVFFNNYMHIVFKVTQQGLLGLKIFTSFLRAVDGVFFCRVLHLINMQI